MFRIGTAPSESARRTKPLFATTKSSLGIGVIPLKVMCPRGGGIRWMKPSASNFRSMRTTSAVHMYPSTISRCNISEGARVRNEILPASGCVRWHEVLCCCCCQPLPKNGFKRKRPVAGCHSCLSLLKKILELSFLHCTWGLNANNVCIDGCMKFRLISESIMLSQQRRDCIALKYENVPPVMTI